MQCFLYIHIFSLHRFILRLRAHKLSFAQGKIQNNYLSVWPRKYDCCMMSIVSFSRSLKVPWRYSRAKISLSWYKIFHISFLLFQANKTTQNKSTMILRKVILATLLISIGVSFISLSILNQSHLIWVTQWVFFMKTEFKIWAGFRLASSFQKFLQFC